MSARALPVALLLAAVAVGSLACSPGKEASAPSEPVAADSAPAPGGEVEPLARRNVLLFFPSSTESGLVGEQREILRTSTPGDQAKQILSDLLAGPAGKSAVAAVPKGTKLLQVYVLEDGTAYADFSEELRAALEPGSDNELLTVYSIVNSIALNVPHVLRVGILVEGAPCETLNGHLDLRRPLPPDRKLLDAGDRGQAPVADGDV